MKNDNEMKYGRLIVCLNDDYYDEDNGKIILDAIAAKYPNNDKYEQFMIIEVINHVQGYYDKVKRGSFLNLNSTYETYYLEETKSNPLNNQDIETEFFKILKERENASWYFNGSDNVKILLKGVSNLKEAEKYAYENYPEVFFGSVIYQDYVCGDFALIAIDSFYMQQYNVNTKEEALILYGKENGFCTLRAEELLDYIER